MGALPKNKISRVERGKRRAGNTPKLLKDTNQKPGLHKRGFVAALFRFVGLEPQGTATPVAESKDKNDKKAKTTAAAQAGTSAMARGRAARNRGGATVKQARVTQHKG